LQTIKKIYGRFCKLEEWIALLLLAGITVLVFVSALMRYIKMPLNWAQDVALVAFAWMIFIGSDIAIRGPGLIGIDIIIKHFPAVVRKGLDIIFKVIIIGFLCVLVYYGCQMTASSWARQITTLHISYSWVYLSVPVGAFLMIISTIIRLVERIHTPADQEITKEKGRDLG
jgi:TRAP-type C4-dicarboxylate transport system permease small subunit